MHDAQDTCDVSLLAIMSEESHHICSICRCPVWLCDAGENTLTDFCPNSPDSAPHCICHGCFVRLPSPKTCPLCRTQLVPSNNSPPFIILNKECEECGLCMNFAGKRMTLKRPPSHIHQTFMVGSEVFSSVCFSCQVADFFYVNNQLVPDSYKHEELLPWESTISDFSDILKGVQNANDHKEQLLMWIPNIPQFHGATNLRKVLYQINDISQLELFVRILLVTSDTMAYEMPCVRDYIKAQLRKKILKLPHTNWTQISDLMSNMSLVFSRKEASEVLLQWLLST